MHPLLTRSRSLLAASALALTAACDFPTAAPHWDMRWNVPVAGTSIAVASLLPAGVSVNAQNTAFLVTVNPVSINRTLSQDCAACVAVSGTVAPKPAFTVDQRSAAALPGTLNSGVVSGGSINVAISHNFTFDPIRVSSTAGATQGYLDIIVRSASVVVGQRRLHGDTATLAPGATRVLNVPLTPGSTLGANVEVQAILNSPAGDPAMMDANRQITVTATPQGIAVSQADVVINGMTVNSGATELDLSDVEQDIIDRVMSGSIILQLENPFAAQGTMELRITGGGVNIVKPFALQPLRNTVTLPFSREELRSMFGKVLSVTVQGPITGTITGNIVRVLPSQVIDVKTRLDVTLCTEANACTP